MKFICTAKISESPDSFPLGDTTVSFSRKKDAKQYVSKKAIDWLIANNFMPSDGSVKFPKVSKSASPPAMERTTSAKGGGSEGELSIVSQVPILCGRLGFGHPTYVLDAAPGTALYSGYAHFGGDPRIEGKIGPFSNIFGRKSAKEKCAQEVLVFLKDIEKQRIESTQESKG